MVATKKELLSDKPHNCPSCEQICHLGLFSHSCSLEPITKTVQPNTWQWIRSIWYVLVCFRRFICFNPVTFFLLPFVYRYYMLYSKTTQQNIINPIPNIIPKTWIIQVQAMYIMVRIVISDWDFWCCSPIPQKHCNFHFSWQSLLKI